MESAISESKTAKEAAIVENVTLSKVVRRRMLGLPLDTWNNILLSSLGIAAVAAAIVGVSTYIVVQLQKQEASDSAEAFAKYKLETGQEIAEAGARASAADDHAATANMEAAKNNERATQLQAALEIEKHKRQSRTVSDELHTLLLGQKERLIRYILCQLRV